MTGIEYGPYREDQMITSGLDYYKPTMSQLWFEKEPDAEVTFTFKNRGDERLADYIDPAMLQTRFDAIRERGWLPEEIDYFRTIHNSDGERVFADGFLEHLQQEKLPPVRVSYDQAIDDIAIEAAGPAPLVTFWETIVMSEVNEAYFEGYVQAQGLDLMEVYDEGDRRLSEKITILQANPDIKFADFGTRRHFSMRWQRHVLQRLQAECPENLLGTSNVGFANTLGMKPIGTFAHEMLMVYAGLADARGQDIRASHNRFLEAWKQQYGEDLTTALTDTFGTEFFFSDFTPEQAEQWRGLRHDSGDAVDFGERVIAFYEELGIDPTTKTIVFSDGLSIDGIVALHDRFGDRINVIFGWGTSLTNDLGLPALNIVMKATHVRTIDGQEADTVKLGDGTGKGTGPPEKRQEYRHDVFRKLPLAA